MREAVSAKDWASCGRRRRMSARMGAAADAAKPSARRRAPAPEGGSLSIRDKGSNWKQEADGGAHRLG